MTYPLFTTLSYVEPYDGLYIVTLSVPSAIEPDAINQNVHINAKNIFPVNIIEIFDAHSSNQKHKYCDGYAAEEEQPDV